MSASPTSPPPSHRKFFNMEISLTLRPLGRGKFSAVLDDDDTELVAASTKPFFTAARLLMERGYDPNSRLVARHAGATHNAMISRLGHAAALDVVEGEAHGPRLVRFKAFPGVNRGDTEGHRATSQAPLAEGVSA